MNIKTHKKKMSKSFDSIYDQLSKPITKEQRLKILKEIRIIDDLFAFGKNIKDKDYKDSFVMWKRVRERLLKVMARQHAVLQKK